MKIDLAVYTGESGYDWHHAGAFTNDELIVYKRIMGKFPDPDFGRMSFGGAFNEGGWLVFYRYHYARRWDNLGRDSLYVVLGRVPLASASSVDFKCAFALTEMNQPMKPFPAATTYIGPKASSAPSFTSQRMFSGTSALSYLGDWFATKPEGRLVVTIDGDYANPRIMPRFEAAAKPVASVSPTPSMPNFGGKPAADWKPGGSGSFPVPPVASQTVSRTACIALSAGLFVLGCTCGYALRGWIGKDGSLGGKLTEKVTEMTGYKIEKVVPPKPETPEIDGMSPTNGLSPKVKTAVTNAAQKVDEMLEAPKKMIERAKKTVDKMMTGEPMQAEPMSQADPKNVKPRRMVVEPKLKSDDSLKVRSDMKVK